MPQRQRKRARRASEKLGERLAKLREEHGMTQEELAKALKTDQSRVSSYENGRIRISVEVLKKLTRIFDVSADELLGLEPLTSVRRDRRFGTRLHKIDKLPRGQRNALIEVIDGLLARRR